MKEILLFDNFFPTVDICFTCEYSPMNLCDGAQMANFWRISASCIFQRPRAAFSDLHLWIRTKATSCVEVW